MKKTTQSTTILTLSALALAVTACTNRNDLDRKNFGNSTTRSGTETREVYQAPGEVGHVETGKGSATIETRKEIIKTETRSERIPTVEEKHVKADINRLSKNEFVKLGLSETVAERVVHYRDEHGNFRSIDALRSVPGMNVGWFNQMRDRLGVSTG